MAQTTHEEQWPRHTMSQFSPFYPAMVAFPSQQGLPYSWDSLPVPAVQPDYIDNELELMTMLQSPEFLCQSHPQDETMAEYMLDCQRTASLTTEDDDRGTSFCSSRSSPASLSGHASPERTSSTRRPQRIRSGHSRLSLSSGSSSARHYSPDHLLSHHHQHHRSHVTTTTSAPTSIPLGLKDPTSADPRPRCFEHGCAGKVFSCAENYRRHVRERSGTSMTECPFCRAQFSRKSNRDTHLAKGRCKALSVSSSASSAASHDLDGAAGSPA